MTIATKALEMVHERDPRLDIEEKIKPYLDRIELVGPEVLVAVYDRPEKTKGGVIITQAKRDEERFQGVAALVLKIGPLAFVADARRTFPVQPKVGEWIMHRASEGLSVHVGPVQCRLVEDVHIRMIVDRPDIIF